MDPVLGAIALSTALAVALLVVQVYQRAAYGRRVVSARLVPAAAGSTGTTPALLRPRRSAGPLLRVIPVSPAAQERTAIELIRAGLLIRVGEYLALRLLSAGGFAALSLLGLTFLGLGSFPITIATLAAAAIGWFVPRMYVSRRRQKRLEKIEKQLPDALTAMGKGLRAGSGLLQALAFAADETPPPLGPELQTTLRDLQLGAEAEDVFEALKDRIWSRDLDIAITAIVIQRTVGGNLSEILANVTNTIRERAKLAGEVRVLTSRQRLTSNLIAAIPVLVAMAFLLLNPDMGRLLTTTLLGQATLAFSVLLELFGIWIIRKLGVIEF